MSPELDKLAPALVALQSDLTAVDKSADNPFFKSKYAPLPEVRKSLQPLLATHKLALTSFPAMVEGKNGLKFFLIHESGQYISGEWQLNPVKQDPQGEGSATTYMRRYGDMAITGLVADEDDDGNAASAHTGSYKATERKPQASASNAASDKQLNLIRVLSKQAGLDQDVTETRIKTIQTSQQASEAIEKLNALVAKKESEQ